MKIKYLGSSVNPTTARAIARAKSYHGPDKKEVVGECLIVYKGDTATIIPMQSYSVRAAMPNPVPYRGVSIGVIQQPPALVYKTITSIATLPDGTPTSLSTWTVDRVEGPAADGSYQTFYKDITVTLYVDGVAFLTGTQTNAWGFSYPGEAAGGYAEWNSIPQGPFNSSQVPSFEQSYSITSGATGTTKTIATRFVNQESRVTTYYDAPKKPNPANPTGELTKTYVMASDGEVLASEVQNTTRDPASGTQLVHCQPEGDMARFGTWNGAGDTWMFDNFAYANYRYDHALSYTVPDDCIYPQPSPLPQILGVSQEVIDSRTPSWQAGVTAFKARRKAWFKKNSDEFIAAISAGFAPGTARVTRQELQTGKLPASWDYAIKTHCLASYKTYQPILMNASYVDAVTSDTSANLTQAGTKVTKRTVTFNYVDAAGIFKQKVIDGYLTQVVAQHTLSGASTISHLDTYVSWYADWSTPTTIRDSQGLLEIPFLTYSQYPPFAFMASTLWDGSIQSGYSADSCSGVQGYVSAVDSPLLYAGLTPPYPKYHLDVGGTAPDFILEYHNTVLPKYHKETPSATHDGSNAWNNSGMYGVKSVSLRLFGPVAADGAPLGVFPDPSDADGSTSLVYYGKATCRFDWATGAITPTDWTEQTPPKVVALPAGYSFFSYGGVSYIAGGVKTTIAGSGQTPTAAGIAASSAVQNGAPYTAAAKVAAADVIQAAVAAAAPVDDKVSPLVASASNIAAALPAAVAAAAAAARATYPSDPPDTAQVKYYILNALGSLHAAYNSVVSYNYIASSMWPDVAKAVVADKKSMGTADPVRALVLSL